MPTEVDRSITKSVIDAAKKQTYPNMFPANYKLEHLESTVEQKGSQSLFDNE